MARFPSPLRLRVELIQARARKYRRMDYSPVEAMRLALLDWSIHNDRYVEVVLPGKYTTMAIYGEDAHGPIPLPGVRHDAFPNSNLTR